MGAIKVNIDALSEKEKKYFKMMRPNSGVPMLLGMPATAKTAIVESIAKKLGYQYIDLRLTQIDESEVGQMPNVQKDENNFKFAIPEWAVMANQQPTIVAVEEFNRASLGHRNAMMQIFNERRIGYSFKFNDDVHFIATGNLGDEDGTETEVLDSAQKTRMIPIKHEITITEWVNDFANENIKPEIVSFLTKNPEYFYEISVMKKIASGESDMNTYANPRTWSFLSDYIVTNFGFDAPSSEWKKDVELIGGYYIGTAVYKFINYLETLKVVTVEDIIKCTTHNKVISLAKSIDRPTQSELMIKIREYDLMKLTKKQRSNLFVFFENIDQDEVSGYVFNSMIYLNQENFTLLKNESSYISDLINKTISVI